MIDDGKIMLLYDSFEKKDMTFEEFRREMREITDVNRMAREANSMAVQKAKARQRAALIDQVRSRV